MQQQKGLLMISKSLLQNKKKSKDSGRLSEKLKKTDITDAMRTEVGACEHDMVSYKALNKACNKLFARSEKDSLQFNELVKEITWHRNTIRELRIAGKKNAKKYNTDFSKMYMEYAKTVDEYIKANEDLSKANQKLIKDINEVTRAYNGLHSMGKFAQEQGIDIKKHQRVLPEYNFSQKDTLLESGKVRHEFNVTKKKKKNGVN